MIRTHHIRRAPVGTIYIGRAFGGFRKSPYCNPFPMRGEADRFNCLLKFAEYWYAPEQKSLRERALVEIPKDADLGCWCHPKTCHCDIIAGYLEWTRARIPRLTEEEWKEAQTVAEWADMGPLNMINEGGL